MTNLTNTTYDDVAPNKIVQSGTSYRGVFINSALFVEGSVGSGSGQFRDVFRLQGPPESPTQAGYNRDSGGTGDESFLGGNTPLRGNELQLDSTGEYYVFVMDMNEGGNVSNGLLSLDQFRVWIKPAGAGGADLFPSANPANNGGSDLGTALGIPAYSMSQIGSENFIMLDSSIQAGSGNSDINIFIPRILLDAQMSASPATDYVYVQAEMGGYVGDTSFSTNSGHESFSAPVGIIFTPVPEPSSLLMIASALVLACRRRR